MEEIRQCVTLGKYSATTLLFCYLPHGSSCPIVCNPLPTGSCINEVHRCSSFRVHNTHSTALLFSKITLHKDHTVYHPALSFSWAYSHQVLVSLARYYGRSCNVASGSRPCVCSYYSSTPPASFCYAASSSCSHRVVHDGACEYQ